MTIYDGVVTRDGTLHPLAGVPQEALDAATKELASAGFDESEVDCDVAAHAVLAAALIAMTQESPAKLAHEETPDDGHTFRISVTSRGAYTVLGDEHAHDAHGFDGEPMVVEVREHSLAAALHKAARVPFQIWMGDE